MLSREHQHNQNDLSQRISAAEERESNQGSPLPNRTPRPPAGGSSVVGVAMRRRRPPTGGELVTERAARTGASSA